jgi:cytochrome c oxidase subunit II
MKPKNLLIVLIFLLCGLALQFPIHLRAQAPKVVEITAKRFAFTPSEITLKKGERVTLKIISQDVTHGLYLKPLKIDADIEPGKTTEVTVTPQTVGKFTAICDHFCGVNHGNMKMTIVVEE